MAKFVKMRRKFKLFVICLFICLINCDTGVEKDNQKNTENSKKVLNHNVKVAESHLTAQVFAIIDHYKQQDPVGLPGATVPDPMPIPEVKQSMSLAKMHMKNVLAYGLSKFRIKHLKTNLNEMNVDCAVQMDQMITKGNYTLSTLFSRAEGPFTVILKNVVTKGNATLSVERDGKIRTQSINIDIAFQDMAMDFQNLGFMGSIFQSIVNSAPTLMFDTMKPFILKEAYSKIRTEIDKNLEKVTGNYSFPNSISPLDMAIAEGRKKVRDLGYDPFKIKDYNQTVGMFGAHISNTWVTGISSFYRVGDIEMLLDNNVVTFGMHLGTQKILGSTQWDLEFGRGMISRAGQAQFTVEHFKIYYQASQSLDVRNRPQLKDIQLELGNIQIRCDGAGTLDYVVEFLVNILPNLLRYQIMDAIESPLKSRIQEYMDSFDVEKFIREKVPEFETMGMNMNFDFKF